MSNTKFKKGDKVQLITFEAAMERQQKLRPYLLDDSVMGLSEEKWNELRKRGPGEIVEVWEATTPEDNTSLRVKFQVSDLRPSTYWIAEDSVEPVPATGPMCPLLKSICKGRECAFWCEFGKMCSVPLLASMFADSTVCQNISEEDKTK